MSAFELPPEHVAVLVYAGSVLRLDRLPVPDGLLALPAIDTTAGRRVIFDLLWSQHIASLAERYGRPLRAEPPMPAVPVWLRTDGDLVQILQWVRCYEYQTTGSSTWPSSFARRYCELLTRAVIDALIERHRPPWVHEPISNHNPQRR